MNTDILRDALAARIQKELELASTNATGELRVALQHQDGEVVAAEVMSRSRTTASIRVPFSAALGRHDVRAFSQFGAFRDRYGPVDLVGRQTLAGALVVTA